jgi:hypothetical protein
MRGARNCEVGGPLDLWLDVREILERGRGQRAVVRRAGWSGQLGILHRLSFSESLCEAVRRPEVSGSGLTAAKVRCRVTAPLSSPATASSSAHGARLERSFGVALEHQVGGAPDIDLGYHRGEKCRLAI